MILSRGVSLDLHLGRKLTVIWKRIGVWGGGEWWRGIRKLLE